MHSWQAGWRLTTHPPTHPPTQASGHPPTSSSLTVAHHHPVKVLAHGRRHRQHALLVADVGQVRHAPVHACSGGGGNSNGGEPAIGEQQR